MNDLMKWLQRHWLAVTIGVVLGTTLSMCAFPAKGAVTDCKNAETKINVIVATGLHWSGTLNADDGDGCYYVFKVDELGMIESATASYGDTVIYQTGQ